MKKFLIVVLMATIAVPRYSVVDNSSGASVSSLYWVVFGKIVVDGEVGKTDELYDGSNTKMTFRGGVLVEDDQL